jgi:hypothetical protein
MPSDPSPRAELGPKQIRMLTLAGTVALPSPKPATGAVYLGLTTGNRAQEAPECFLTEFCIKSVQTVSDELEVTRIIRLGDVRAFEIYKRDDQGRVVGSEIKTIDDPEILKLLVAAKEELIRSDAFSYRLLFAEAVLIVPEAAPVYVRVVRELGVTAAVAAQYVEGCIPFTGPHCCPTIEPLS